MSRGQRRHSGRQSRSNPNAKIPPRGAGAFPPNLEPVALEGDFVRLRPEGIEAKVRGVEAVPTVKAFDSDRGNDVATTSGTTDSDNDALELEQRTHYVAQFRPLFPQQDIPDGISEVQVDQGGGQSPIWNTGETRGFMEQDSASFAGYSALLELYIHEDDSPLFTFVNDGSQGDVTVSDIRFGGFQYELDPDVSVPGTHQPAVLPTEATSSVGSRQV